ncbi:MAG: glycoside hydrolase family 99-like domain-containing protein [Verrucomicrobia bacterium]|nr:glycoside hydrolase family 99-like domain-containing protein [Verrucomicrobiota bacterium]
MNTRRCGKWLLYCLSVFCGILLAHSAETEKPRVGVYYFPGWYRTGGETFKPPYDKASDWSEWRGAIAKAPSPRPLAGFYDDSDPRLWNYYIPWMRGHGIDFITFDWYYNAGQDYLYESLDRGFLGAAGNEQMEFCLTWCNHGGYWWSKPIDQSKPALTEMTERVASRYLHRSNYLKHEGKPVFMIYEVDLLLDQNGGVEKTREALDAMRRVARKHGHPDLYLVAVYSYYSPDIIGQLREIGFDAFCGYNYVGLKSARVNWDSKSYPYRDVADRLIDYIYPHLKKTGAEKQIPYWPTVFAGWDNSPRVGAEATILTDNTPSEFGRLFQHALKNVNPASPFVIVEAWNEWGENSFIEPSKQHGFGYLREMASALGKKRPFDESLPTTEEIASWSILSPAELKIAEANENKPKLIEEPKWFQFGKSEKAPAPEMPVTISFGTNGIDFKNVYVKNLEVIERDANGVTFKTKGGECGIEISIEKIPTQSVRSIRIEAELLNQEQSTVPIPCEFYWATSYMPNFSPFASVFTLLRPGQPIIIPTHELPGWKDTGTPLTRLRLDLGRKKGLLM